MEIRALRATDERGQFQSGDADLDRFFSTFASQNQFRHYVGVTYVATENERVLGYATVAPGQLEIDAVPAAMRKRLPRYPLPVLRLARLAVDGSARGRGLGAALLRYVLRLAVRMSEDFGCVGVVVDAKAPALDFYRQYGFIQVDALEGNSDVRPRLTPMFLSMRAIKGAPSI